MKKLMLCALSLAVLSTGIVQAVQQAQPQTYKSRSAMAQARAKAAVQALRKAKQVIRVSLATAGAAGADKQKIDYLQTLLTRADQAERNIAFCNNNDEASLVKCVNGVAEAAKLVKIATKLTVDTAQKLGKQALKIIQSF